MKVYRSVLRRPSAIEPGHVGDGYWESGHQSMSVLEDDTPHDTGLLDASGNPIISVNAIGPIGFGRH